MYEVSESGQESALSKSDQMQGDHWTAWEPPGPFELSKPPKAPFLGQVYPEEKLMETDSTLARIEPGDTNQSPDKSRGGEQAESDFRKEFTIIKLAKIIEDGTLLL